MANEKRLIDANALSNAVAESQYYNPHPPGRVHINHINEHNHFLRMIMDAPTVDAVEVKCKVGGRVYALWGAPVKQKYIIYCAECKEIRIGMRNCRLTTTYRLEPIMYRGHIHEYRGEDFGKLVFQSEKEAEATLAKMDRKDDT